MPSTSTHSDPGGPTPPPTDGSVDESGPFTADRIAPVDRRRDDGNDGNDDEFDDDDEFEDDDTPVAGAQTEPNPEATQRRSSVRRVLSVLLATIAFEILYAVGIGLVTFFSGGVAAVGPTLLSVIGTPFAWAPAAVFLLCSVALSLTLRGGRRALTIGTLVAAVVVYLGSTLVVLLVAGGWAALSVYTQELGVYPFFLAGIIAREVLFWTSRARVPLDTGAASLRTVTQPPPRRAESI